MNEQRLPGLGLVNFLPSKAEGFQKFKMADITQHAFEIKFPFSITEKVSIYIKSSHKLY